MFAYCRSNPVNRIDSHGMTDGTANKNEGKSFWEEFLEHMARKRKDGHTFSVGFTTGATWGDSGGSTSYCLSVDNSYNYATQRSDSLCAGAGTGASGGLVFTYTSADNVQDLKGPSSTYGATICAIFGLSIDYIEFTAATDPDKECWGISVSLLYGAEADIHRGESFTTSSESWNPFKALSDWLYSN